MPSQNINSHYYSKYKTKLNYGYNFDLTLSSDERDYDEEVVFSNEIIGENDGNRLPIFFDLNNNLTSTQPFINFGDYISGNTLVSKNYYNPNNQDLSCFTAYTGTCDIGLVGTDNGLYTKMSGQTLYYMMGVDDTYKFNPHYRDRRFKMHPITGYTQLPNVVFSGRPKNTIYNIVYKNDVGGVGYYQELYGGFYQGFYKLNGYDYEVFPNRVNKGWTAEMLLKPRIDNEHFINNTTEEYLNNKYPNNSGTFFYFGTRSENKYYHNAGGSPQSDTGYTRTTSGLTCLQSCACSDTGVTNSDCVNIYPNTAFTINHNVDCDCGCVSTVKTPLPETDPKFDSLSNSLSLKFDGDPFNPRICIKYLKITGSCTTTGLCETTGVTFQTGATITEHCTTPIYDICNYNSCNSQTERWVMISAVFERYTTIEDCDLLNLGGLNDLRVVTTQSSIDGQSYKLISPPETHLGSKLEPKIHKVRFNKKWFDELDYRLGTLKLYVNGYLFYVIEDFEEIIPRELNTEKEKQVGVPYNLSFGGGTQGLHDHLIFSGCSNPNGSYTQDPELFPNNILSATTLSGLSTNILLEQNFGGTFMGGISQFRMYVEPLGSPQIQHNFRVLKNKFDLFDYRCPNCYKNYIVDENGNLILTDDGSGLIYCAYDDDINNNFVFDDYQESVEVNIEVIFSEGSIVLTNNVTISKTLNYEFKTSITKKVELLNEPPIEMITEVIIPAGSLSGSTVVMVDKDYSKLISTSKIDSVSYNVGNAFINTISTSKSVIFDTPPLTPTPTPTVTPTPTPTPTVTPTVTPTPTPTPQNMNKVYYGKIQNNAFNDVYLNNMEVIDTDNILSRYLFYSAEPGYCYILVPENMNQPSTFRNSNDGCDGFLIPFVKLINTQIIDLEGNVVNYYVYRSFVSTKASVDVWVCD
jgi:hypothetical protein